MQGVFRWVDMTILAGVIPVVTLLTLHDFPLTMRTVAYGPVRSDLTYPVCIDNIIGYTEGVPIVERCLQVLPETSAHSTLILLEKVRIPTVLVVEVRSVNATNRKMLVGLSHLFFLRFARRRSRFSLRAL